MSWFDGLRERVRFMVARGRVERELEEELAFHQEREVERLRALGMTQAEAERAARVSFGGRDRHVEESRRVWAGILSGVGQDLRRGFRRLGQNPGFTVVALVTLALGIGANTAVFSLVRGVLMEPLPYPEPDRLVMIWDPDRTRETWLSQRELLEYGAAVESFEALGGWGRLDANLTEGEPERVRGATATAGALEVLGARTSMGRLFTPEEDTPGRSGVVLLGHGLWERRFGASPEVVGSTIRVNGEARTVVGVLAPGFRLPLDLRDGAPTELVVPMAIDGTQELAWGNRGQYGVARLADGVTEAAATAEMRGAYARWLDAGLLPPGDGRELRRAYPLDDLLLGGVRPALLLLFAAVACVLLIACANVAHLLLARADARRRETAVHAALGASRLRVIRSLLVESGVLALLGAGLGLALGWAGLRAVLALSPVEVVGRLGVGLDLGVLLFTALLALLTTLAAGLGPALRASGGAPAALLGGARGEGAVGRSEVRRLLVILETALSLVLVVGAGLLVKSFVGLRAIDPGFDFSGVLTARVTLPTDAYPDAPSVDRFFGEVLDRLEALPGVEAAGAVRLLPLASSMGSWTITLEGRTAGPEDGFDGDWQIATPGYFRTMGLQLLSGRLPTEADDGAAPLVAVIGEGMARAYWPGEDPLGKRFHLGTLDQPWITVVGVVRPVRHNSVTEAPRAEMILPLAQWPVMRGDGRPQRAMALVLRTPGDPLALAGPLREQVRAVDPTLPVAEIRTMDDLVGEALAGPRFTALLLGVFAALALLLAVVGLYGVISFTAARRTHELGIRLALGAEPARVTRLVMGEGLATAGIGVVLGVLAAGGLTRFLAGQLHGVRPLDPAVFVAVPALLLVVAAVASWVPARRAASVSPVLALRQE